MNHQTFFNKHDAEFMKKLSTKRLLTYFRSWRRRTLSTYYRCDCCGEFTWEIDLENKDREAEYKELTEYVALIKKELDSREHVIRRIARRKVKSRRIK